MHSFNTNFYRALDIGYNPAGTTGTILDRIIATKQKEIEANKKEYPVKLLESMPGFNRSTISLASSLRQMPGIITEFKRRSPSKGIINNHSTIKEVVGGYDEFGAAAISILTDQDYFGGSNEDLEEGRGISKKPILRKDFIIDEYQIVEAKAIGADLILLIAANLTPAQVKRLAAFAKNLELEILLELHVDEELDHYCDEVDLVGINNRNLKNFDVNLEHSIRLAEKLPAEKLKIAESGINNVETVLYLKQQGFDGFLMGEYFMKQPDPAKAFGDFKKQLSW